MKDWLDTLREAPPDPFALITVASTRGSAPREVGARMLVGADGIAGTIGGGNLEFQAIDMARERLQDTAAPRARMHRFALGPSLGQCCGGVVELLFETVTGNESCFSRLHELRGAQQTVALISITDGKYVNTRVLLTDTACHGELPDSQLLTSLLSRARDALTNEDVAELFTVTDSDGKPVRALFQVFRRSDFQVLVFGAGHVGKALVPLLAQLPCEIRWIDPRADEFPDLGLCNVRQLNSAAPEYCADDAPPDSYYLIMTHSHALDQAICERVLRRGDFTYCGLIGSRAKRRKFEKRLRARGISAATLQRLVCPIGVAGIEGKRPAEIAVAVAAQLLIEYGQRHTNETTPPQTRVVSGE